MPRDRPPRVVLTALALAVVGLLLNQAAVTAWLVLVVDGRFSNLPLGDDGWYSALDGISTAAGATSGAVSGLALWGLFGWGLWHGRRWARAGATVLAGSAGLYGLAPLVVLPLARRLLQALPGPLGQVELPGLGALPVVLGVAGSAFFLAAVTMLWVRPAGVWFHRDLLAKDAGLR